jgi:hypothetical protein
VPEPVRSPDQYRQLLRLRGVRFFCVIGLLPDESICSLDAGSAQQPPIHQSSQTRPPTAGFHVGTTAGFSRSLKDSMSTKIDFIKYAKSTLVKICSEGSQKACDEIRQKNEISSRMEGCLQ